MLITEQSCRSELESEQIAEKTRLAFKTINETYDRFSGDEVFLAFNGGKDCTVLLHLVATALENRTDLAGTSLFCLYMQPEEPFDEIEHFVEACKKNYNITVRTIRAQTKVGLTQVCHENPNLKACLMGSRRTDPHCADLNTFQQTDGDWPDLMRISPLLDWTCDNVWSYIHINNIDYCSLYDLGYTSLGDRKNTIPNPHLQYINPDTQLEEYRPAYFLKNADELERAGRLRKI